MNKSKFKIPPAPKNIKKGSTLAVLLDRRALEYLAHNISLVHPAFETKAFRTAAGKGLAPLGILDRGKHIAGVLRRFLPERYAEAVSILIRSLSPPLKRTDGLGLGSLFYLPHVYFVAQFGLDLKNNDNRDPFEISMKAQYELTRRFSSEFSIREYLIRFEKRTLERLMKWTKDRDPHVRRLCSEGTRPRLPWARQIPMFVKNPRPVFPILEALKDDSDLYVRRSVANHLGDIAKDHPNIMFSMCERWLKGASKERKWLIRHALRHPAKKGVLRAIRIRGRTV